MLKTCSRWRQRLLVTWLTFRRMLCVQSRPPTRRRTFQSIDFCTSQTDVPSLAASHNHIISMQRWRPCYNWMTAWRHTARAGTRRANVIFPARPQLLHIIPAWVPHNIECNHSKKLVFFFLVFARGGTVVRSAADCNLKLRDEAQTGLFRSSTLVLSVGFFPLQTDAPSNLFIHGWAVGDVCCHSMASAQRLPVSSPWLMFSVCSYGCSWACASRFFLFLFSVFIFFLLLPSNFSRAWSTNNIY